MFSGSRCCLKNKVNKRLLPGDIILNHPLLFHYPRWFRAKQQPKFAEPSAHDPSKTLKLSVKYILPEQSEEAEVNVVEPSYFRYVSQQPPQNPTEAQLKARSEKLETIVDERRARQGKVVQEQRPNGLRRREYVPASGSTSSIQQYGKRKKRSIHSVRSNWERALNMLANSVPQHKEVEGQEIWLSKQTLIALSGTSGTNSWVHNVGGGCEVQVTDTQSYSGSSKQVLLNGSTRAVALTMEYFIAIEKDVMQYQENQVALESVKTPTDTTSKTESIHCEADATSAPNVPFRIVPTAVRGYLKHGDWMRADQFPQPALNSVRSFKEYVEKLTSIRAPRLVRRELYGTQDDTHNMAVADMLSHLFTDTNNTFFASSVALNLAFAFLCGHTELLPQISLLYDQCRQLRLTLPPQTYSYILRAMLLQGEMEMFGQVLNDLCSQGYGPDSRIWLALLKSGPSMTQKRAVAKWMLHKGLLGNSLVKREVAAELIAAELSGEIDDGKHADLSVRSIDARFGPDWMSQSSVTRTLAACAEKQAWTPAFEIFQEAQRRNVNFDHTAAHAIFLVMQQRGSLRDSLDLLRSHFVATTGRNDHTVIPIVFMTAWKHRFYNVCRILWRYAAVLGAMTYKMQNVVTQSLLRNQDTPNARASKAGLSMANLEWKRRAGKVLVGTDLDITEFQQFFDLASGQPGTTLGNPMVWLAQYTSDGGQRDQQLLLGYVMMHRDLHTWKYFAPPSSERLFKLLSDAYAMDVRWKGEGIGLERGGKSIQWMIENAIDMPLVRREISLKRRPLDSDTTIRSELMGRAAFFDLFEDIAHSVS
ncbi:hypothetical protein GJ744_012231 [Endocarpon pusillum]|uniref:Pentatricopeptide repeat domain-containing protein n=1 Tax=Endocarpon pusillum TaxID=364733 RepID=A0A8H7E288_9EURO|nr:hypothetical protein GJ744_012231 [Endocarpon pusillum]